MNSFTFRELTLTQTLFLKEWGVLQSSRKY